jgi:hypothetical protein
MPGLSLNGGGLSVMTVGPMLSLAALFSKLTTAVEKFWDTISAPFKAIGKIWNWITGGVEALADYELPLCYPHT